MDICCMSRTSVLACPGTANDSSIAPPAPMNLFPSACPCNMCLLISITDMTQPAHHGTLTVLGNTLIRFQQLRAQQLISAYSCSAHVCPCAQGRCGRWPLGFGVMSDFMLIFIFHFLFLACSTSMHPPLHCLPLQLAITGITVAHQVTQGLPDEDIVPSAPSKPRSLASEMCHQGCPG